MFSKEETKQLSLAFWHKLESKTRRLPGQNGRAKIWIANNTGIPNLDLRFDVDRQHCIVALELRNHGSEKSYATWEKLLSCKTIFEETYGSELIWDDAYEKSAGDIVYRIYVTTPGDIYRQELWPDMIYFLIDNMIKMERAFLEVQDYLRLF